MKKIITLIFLCTLATAEIHPLGGTSASGGAVWGTDSNGVAPTKSPLFVAGSDGSLVRVLSTDANGYLKVLLQNSSIAVTGTFWQSVQPVSGSVSVSNFPSSQPVTGAFYQATQPVSIASMPSTPVTGTFWPTTQPVSGTFWQSIQPVSGTVSVNVISGFALETGGNLASIKTDVDKIPSQGQALAGSSMPVVLPAAQITTLTPPTTVATTAADGSNAVLGAKADAKNTATDITPLTMMQVLKQISASVQAPPSQAVTGT